jgi:hypothetical protein
MKDHFTTTVEKAKARTQMPPGLSLDIGVQTRYEDQVALVHFRFREMESEYLHLQIRRPHTKGGGWMIASWEMENTHLKEGEERQL